MKQIKTGRCPKCGHSAILYPVLTEAKTLIYICIEDRTILKQKKATNLPIEWDKYEEY